MTGIKQAVAAIGTQDKLAEALGLKQQTVSVWVTRGYAPVAHIPTISALTGVPRRELVSPTILQAIAVLSQDDLF